MSLPLSSNIEIGTHHSIMLALHSWIPNNSGQKQASFYSVCLPGFDVMGSIPIRDKGGSFRAFERSSQALVMRTVLQDVRLIEDVTTLVDQ